MKNDKLNVLVAASEASPLAQAGGLGDVIGSLPLAFSDMGHNVSIILPAYRRIMEENPNLKIVAKDLPISLGKIGLTADVLAGELAPHVPAYFVRRDEFFDRSELYGSSQGEYLDNRERYIFFSRSIPAFCEALDFSPDIILANDWQTGLLMALMDEGALPNTAGVFAIHNLGYMGLVPPERIEVIGLPDRYYTMEGLEYFGQISLLKAGIVYAQEVVTVSPTYAKEIQDSEYGNGMAGLMYSVRNRLNGILNGVNYEIWNPATDHNIAANFSPQRLSGKAICKKALLKEMDLPDDLLEKPVLAIVTRLFDQKGCKLIAEAADELFALDLGLVLLADGDINYQRLFAKIQSQYPTKCSVRFGFDPILSHKIIAGSDIFLMPSLYEPCGLTQMYSLKYGTIPVVRATGGLQDTVIDPDELQSRATGFKFNRFHKDDMIASVRRAIKTFEKPKLWRSMMANAMSQDFSWEHSAKEYIRVFYRALASRRRKAWNC